LPLTATFAADNRAVSASKISLPSGPGSIEGLGESFEPQLNTGTYAMGLPFKLPPVRGAVQPEVRISYNSGSGNGSLGLGWRLDVPCLQRQTDKGLPLYNDATDTFVNHGGEELVRLTDGTLRAENETDFTKYENLGTNGWKVTRRDGSILRFGQTAQARQNHDLLGTFKWMLESAEDVNGNRVEYTYTTDAGQIYLSQVTFGKHASLQSSIYQLTFQYDTNRVDNLTDYRGRFRCETRWRLASATLTFGGRRIRFWKMDYVPNYHLSLLASFTQYGDNRSATNGTAQVNVDYLPPVTYDYARQQLGQGAQWVNVGPFQNINFAIREADLVDVNRDGLQDVLLYEQGKYYSYLNRGPGQNFGPSQEFTSSVFYPALADNKTRLSDLRGDGSVKVLVDEAGQFYYRAFTSATTLGTDVDYLVPGNFPISDPNVQVVDIDNDRALDFVAADQATFSMALSRSGTGSATIQTTQLPEPISFAAGWQLADMNGDRMPDLVLIGNLQDGETRYYAGKGFGQFDTNAVQIAHGPAGPTRGESETGARLILVDIDGDGLSDLLHVASGVVKIWANRSGKSWADPVPINNNDVPDYLDGGTSVRFADMNGNGTTDIVWNDPQAGIFLKYLELHPGLKPNVLTKMSNGMGRTLEIEYKTSTDFMLADAGTPNAWTKVPPFPIPVVSAFTEKDGLGSTYRTEITYRNGYYDALEREFRGFETAIRKDVGNDAQFAPSLLTEYLFDTGATVEALKGKPIAVERRNVAGEIFDRVSTVWTNRFLPVTTVSNETRKVTFAFQTSEQTTAIERGVAAPVTLLREFEWDNFGNQTKMSDYGRVEGVNKSAWDDERITTTTFTSAFPDGLAKWILGLPVTETIEDENGVVVTKTESFYDDEGFGGANAGNVTKGNLTMQRRWVDGAGSKKIIAARNKYDGYGNVTETYDPLATPGNFANGHARQFAYDNQIHTHPVTETIHVGGGTPALVVNAVYDIGLGVMTSSVDFNGNPSSYRFDTFGRVEAIIKPGDTDAFPTEMYAYQLGIAVTTNQTINFIEAKKRETAGAGTVDSRLFFDGLGRKVMVRAEGETPGQIVVSDTVVYNDRRAVWKKYLPYFDGGGLGWKDPMFVTGFVENRYDALGRVTSAYQPEVDGARVFAETVYEPLAKLIKDEEQTRQGSIHTGSGMRHIEDGLRNKDGAGRLREVQEIVKETGAGAPAGSPETWITRYAYDLLDQLTRIEDSQNNIKTMQYDGLARLVHMDDLDRGKMDYVYDDASNLSATTDNKNQVIQYTYDGVNRIKAEDYVGSGNNPDVAYFYDASQLGFPGTNVKGQLAAVRDLSGEEHFSYDARSRMLYQTKRIPDPQVNVLVSFITRYEYDSLDRLTKLTYPDGDQVMYQYNDRSLLQRITGGPSGSIISSVSYRASGQLASIGYGNGVGTTYAYDPRLRLVDLDTVSPSAGPLIDFHYTFDAASNITKIDDLRDLTGQTNAVARLNTQQFGYDSLYRLTKVVYPTVLNGNPGQIDYAYDRIGNMVSQLSNIPHVEDGKPITNLGNMSYGGTDGPSGRTAKGTQPGPHALTEIANPQSAIRNYSYDANGNMTNIDGLACTWDFKDRLVAVENDKMRAEYTYDYTDRRITKKVTPKSSGAPPSTLNSEPSTVTYINKYFEIREYDSPVKYVWNGDTRVARVTGSLDPNTQRTQWLRVHPGWNLKAVAVGGAQAQLDPANQPLLGTAVSWSANTSGSGYSEIKSATSLPGGSPVWLYAKEGGVLTLNGTPTTVTNVTVAAGGQFVPNISGEKWDVASVFPSDMMLCGFTPGTQMWRNRLAGSPPFLSSVPAQFSNGDTVFAKPGATNTLSIPSAVLRIRYYHQDHLGSSSVISDQSGALVEEIANYPFGYERNGYRPKNRVEAYTFTQKERDGESGLHYFEARSLVSSLARFASVDSILSPISDQYDLMPGSANPYAYCASNPLTSKDPAGREKILNSSQGFIEITGTLGKTEGFFEVGVGTENLKAAKGSTTFSFDPVKNKSEMCLSADVLNVDTGKSSHSMFSAKTCVDNSGKTTRSYEFLKHEYTLAKTPKACVDGGVIKACAGGKVTLSPPNVSITTTEKGVTTCTSIKIKGTGTVDITYKPGLIYGKGGMTVSSNVEIKACKVSPGPSVSSPKPPTNGKNVMH
jgi:RHS repeat-associated protein